jgi:hypothetical protein
MACGGKKKKKKGTLGLDNGTMFLQVFLSENT